MKGYYLPRETCTGTVGLLLTTLGSSLRFPLHVSLGSSALGYGRIRFISSPSPPYAFGSGTEWRRK